MVRCSVDHLQTLANRRCSFPRSAHSCPNFIGRCVCLGCVPTSYYGDRVFIHSFIQGHRSFQWNARFYYHRVKYRTISWFDRFMKRGRFGFDKLIVMQRRVQCNFIQSDLFVVARKLPNGISWLAGRVEMRIS